MGVRCFERSKKKFWQVTKVKMATWVLIVLVFQTIWVTGQSLNALEQKAFPSNESFRIFESQKFGNLFSLFLNLPNEENSYALGDALLKDDKPLPAKAVVLFAVKQFPNSDLLFGGNRGQETLKDLLQRVETRIKFLEKKYLQFAEELERTKQVSALLSMASIKFHSGHIRAAVGLLGKEMLRYGHDTGLLGMKKNFYLENQINSIAFLMVEKNFTQELQQKRFETSSQYCGQLIYLGIYAEEPLECVNLLKQKFPDKIDDNAIRVLDSIPQTINDHNF